MYDVIILVRCWVGIQIPGKLLNPNDYDPTNKSMDATVEKFQSTIPPKIGEVN